jgi:hypothetical protein
MGWHTSLGLLTSYRRAVLQIEGHPPLDDLRLSCLRTNIGVVYAWLQSVRRLWASNRVEIGKVRKQVKQ